MNCIDHLGICQAECCKEYSLTFPENTIIDVHKKILSVRINIMPDIAHYYRLHRADYTRGILRIRLKNFELQKNKLIIKSRCKLLTSDNKCLTHPNKPNICKKLNEETAKNPIGFYVTPNCIYKPA
jgi:Fe-S-cluster containining protein